MNSNELILVTGAGGFIAMHVIEKFIREGYKVRGTMRSLSDTAKVEWSRRIADARKLELVEADLLEADSWKTAMNGVTVVVHVASPGPNDSPKDPMEVIRPALDGTLNVLREAFKHRDTVRRVVLTSSLAAVVGGNREAKVYNENDFAEPSSFVFAYGKSKALAEKAAWDFVDEKRKKNEKCFELVVINPAFTLGPSLHGQSVSLSMSELTIKSYLEGSVQELPRVGWPICDVRDVADAHFIGAFSPQAVGHRHIIVTQTDLVPLTTVAGILRDEFGPKGFTNIPSKVAAGANYIAVRLDNSRMLNVLGIKPIDLKKTLIDAANSLIQNGTVKKP